MTILQEWPKPVRETFLVLLRHIMNETKQADKNLAGRAAIELMTVIGTEMLSTCAGFFPLSERDEYLEMVLGVIRDVARKRGGALGGVARYDTGAS